MDGFLDIYTRLIIAVISFVAPVIVYLLSVFTDGIPIIRKKGVEKRKQISKLLKVSLSDEQIDSKKIKKQSAALLTISKEDEALIRLLKPQRQINRIFISLFLALMFVMLYELVKDKTLFLYHHWLAVTLLALSFLSFIAGIFILRKVAWAVVDTKRMIAEDNTAETISS